MLEKEPMTQHPDPGRSVEMVKQGMVFKKSLAHYFVNLDNQMVDCSLSSKLRKELIYPIADPASIRPHVVAVEDIRMVDPVAIGDLVRFVDNSDGTGMIVEVLPRKSKLVRRAAGSKPLEQVIVANVDQVVAIVAAAKPTPKWDLLDRYLVAAESLGLSARICITKLDLVAPDQLAEEVQTYQQIGYPVMLTSTVTGAGVEAFKQALKGRISVFAGKSGVGKTSLLNTIQPGLGLRVNEVSQHTGKGKHTTSHLEMFGLDGGGGVIDTPGMREFGLWNVTSADLASLFPEMRPYAGTCRFGVSCSHVHEPNCAIKEAVAAGKITPRRYQSYLKIRRSCDA